MLLTPLVGVEQRVEVQPRIRQNKAIRVNLARYQGKSMTIEKERKTTFEPATERDDAAYLDFVTGTRAFTPVMDKKVFEDTEVAV